MALWIRCALFVRMVLYHTVASLCSLTSEFQPLCPELIIARALEIPTSLRKTNREAKKENYGFVPDILVLVVITADYRCLLIMWLQMQITDNIRPSENTKAKTASSSWLANLMSHVHYTMYCMTVDYCGFLYDVINRLILRKLLFGIEQGLWQGFSDVLDLISNSQYNANASNKYQIFTIVITNCTVIGQLKYVTGTLRDKSKIYLCTHHHRVCK
jgi:hypothetical protein